MVTKHKISAELYDDSFKLIAMHCGLESHAMAYHLNKSADLQLARCKEDLDVSSTFFPLYEWKDEINDYYWTLVCNTVKEELESEALGLFLNQKAVNTYHLVQERKEVDYFLKVETTHTTVIEKAVKKINSIPKVLTAYSVDVATLKSKRNLIF